MKNYGGRYRLALPAKILIFVMIIGMLVSGVYFALKSGVIKASDKTNEVLGITVDDVDDNGNIVNTSKVSDDTINLSLDEWIGWKPIIDANGGLSTQPGSIYDSLGIDVNISIINDATQSSNAMISGDIDAAGYTINRVAFLSQKFKDAGIDVIMPYITNFSNGGDGIIAKSNINSVNDLVGAKIGVPKFSEAHSLVIWFVNQSNLSDADKQSIIDNLIMFDTPDECGNAFFAGEIDVAATWEPFLSKTQEMSDAHVFFSTASSSSLIMDGVLFNNEFAKANPDVVEKFIDGALQAGAQYDTNTSTIKDVMPMFSTSSDEDIKANCASAKLMTYADNINMFDGTARDIFASMCDVWSSIGESVNKELVNTLYDSAYIEALSGKYDANDLTKTDANVSVNESNMNEVMDTEAMLTRSATVNFIKSTAKFTDSAEATAILDDFIATAKILDGTIIEIAGNCDPNPISDPDDTYNKMLSQQRAETVKQYFIMNGISPDRIVTVGNGSSKPVASNDTEEGRAMNRRTDVSFKIIER